MSSQIELLYLSQGFIRLVAGVEASRPGQFILPPHPDNKS